PVPAARRSAPAARSAPRAAADSPPRASRCACSPRRPRFPYPARPLGLAPRGAARARRLRLHARLPLALLRLRHSHLLAPSAELHVERLRPLRPLVRSNEAEPLVAYDTLDGAGHRAALVRSPVPLGKLRASFPRGDRPSQVHVDFLKLPPP